MLIKTLPVGPIQANCYIVSNENTLECVVIDPGDESSTILDYLEDNKLKCRAILLTHGHFDHTGAALAVSGETGAPIYIHEKDCTPKGSFNPMSFSLPENGRHLSEGDVLELAGMKFEIMETPGHTPGGVTIRCGEALFTGDTLFKGSCGRVDFPGGDMEQELLSLKRLCALPGDYEVYPGHMECSTLEQERCFNYSCRQAMMM